MQKKGKMQQKRHKKGQMAFFMYRSRNKDVATLNSIVATRKIVLAAKSGNNFIAHY